MADREKFADAVASRFSGGSTAPAAPADDETEDTGSSSDAENGRLLQQALKRGDGAAICEAVRRIAGV
jgi:hypothetical protein